MDYMWWLIRGRIRDMACLCVASAQEAQQSHAVLPLIHLLVRKLVQVLLHAMPSEATQRRTFTAQPGYAFVQTTQVLFPTACMFSQQGFRGQVEPHASTCGSFPIVRVKALVMEGSWDAVAMQPSTYVCTSASCSALHRLNQVCWLNAG